MDKKSSEEMKMSMTQVQVNYQIEKLYMMTKILKCRSVNLIMLYYCIYSGLLDTTEVLMRILLADSNKLVLVFFICGLSRRRNALVIVGKKSLADYISKYHCECYLFHG